MAISRTKRQPTDLRRAGGRSHCVTVKGVAEVVGGRKPPILKAGDRKEEKLRLNYEREKMAVRQVLRYGRRTAFDISLTGSWQQPA